MPRQITQTNKVALLATGDEITHGDILNTNTREIARRLFDHGIQVGIHLTAPDNLTDLEQAIHFLLAHHRALIITGGLGPTSDDLTRFALSKALNEPLVHDSNTWDAIVSRLQKFGYIHPPESNRQQALFPKNAIIIPNPHGTAAGCQLTHQDQLIFMLPGPPSECLPMFEQAALPMLIRNAFQQIAYHENWLLFGVSEGQIAEQLDKLAKPYDCITGYRLAYPYIEFKLHSNNPDDFNALKTDIEKVISPYLIGSGKQMASELLSDKLKQLRQPLNIHDHATGGLLETQLNSPDTAAFLTFNAKDTETPHIVIKGLEEFWQKKSSTETTLEIYFNFEKKHHEQFHIPFRSDRVKSYAAEFICWKLLNFINAEA